MMNFESGPGFDSIVKAKTWLDGYLRGAATERSHVEAERSRTQRC